MAQNSSHVKVGEVILKQKKNNKNTDTTAHRPVYRGSGVTVGLTPLTHFWGVGVGGGDKISRDFAAKMALLPW